MTKKNYSKYEAKEELVTLSFNHVLLHKKDTKIYQVIFLSLLNVYCGTISYSGITEKGTCTIVLNRNRINSPKSFRFTFQPMYYTESNPAGQYFGVLYYEYPYKVDLNTEKSIIINLPDVTDKLFSQYYLLGEYIQVTPNGIKWRGEYYKKQQ